jgi:hypothetical protein
MYMRTISIIPIFFLGFLSVHPIRSFYTPPLAVLELVVSTILVIPFFVGSLSNVKGWGTYVNQEGSV